ncbi:MAG: ABC-F family ATP-binding cassette domain-containing protein [Proteobacteria bacterium]|nr:ABC-F family ATP-binding cassette domain-containing protein [Pseudomonadota bacterium]
MINLSNATKRFGDRILYQNASFLVRPGDKIGLVGPNGAGKSTIFRIIAGRDHLDDGTLSIDPGVLVGFFDQNVGEMRGRSALAECMAGVGRVSEIGAELAKMEERMGRMGDEPMGDDEMNRFMERFGELQMEFQNRGGYDLESRAQAILTGLGIGPVIYDRPVESFSGGWKMRIALAQILLLNPDVLLMDEPTNHLDIESIIWLEEWLKSFKGALVMTSHDREFMNRICGRTIEIANKTITTYSGNYDFYLKDRELRREQQISAFKRQQEMLSKEEEFIAKFAARASHAAQVQSRVKKLDKIERVEMPVETKKIHFEFGQAPRSGNDVVRMESLAKVYDTPEGGTHSVFSGISGVISRQNKIALTGVNGAGKSTLLKVIAGLTEPTSGKSILGASVNMGYFSQYSCDLLTAENTIWEEVTNRLPLASIGYLRSLLGAFMFSGDDIDKKIRMLSGGEKSRVMLACILAQPVNFLILDEPTNHLDIDSRETLLEALQQFDGTVLIVSHDRYFLHGLANRVFEIDHGIMRTYEGDYSYYLEKKAILTK